MTTFATQAQQQWFKLLFEPAPQPDGEELIRTRAATEEVVAIFRGNLREGRFLGLLCGAS